MHPSWIHDPYRSYLGGSIYHTVGARYNQAVQWYRTLINLGFPQDANIIRLARFIRHGVLNSAEASQIFYDRLPNRLKARYSLMIHWIEEDWLPESHFYFMFIDWSCLSSEKVESTALFPLVEPDFSLL